MLFNCIHISFSTPLNNENFAYVSFSGFRDVTSWPRNFRWQLHHRNWSTITTMKLSLISCSLLGFLLPLVSATALTYKLTANEKACFFSHVDNKGSKIAFYFAVRTPWISHPSALRSINLVTWGLWLMIVRNRSKQEAPSTWTTKSKARTGR